LVRNEKVILNFSSRWHSYWSLRAKMCYCPLFP